MTGGSGTEPFAAEINRAGDAYEGVFTVGDEVYNVTGHFNDSNQDGEYFVFEAPLSELQPTVSPVTPLGFTWSGTMTESTYQGGWFIFRGNEDGNPSQEGGFILERRP